MEAFVAAPALGSRSLWPRRARKVCPISTVDRHFVCAKKSGGGSENAKDIPPRKRKQSSSPFGGMAAGPNNAGGKGGIQLGKTSAERIQTEAAGVNDDSVGDGTSAKARNVRGLGRKKPRSAPPIRAKTAEDFVAEGVEDDVEEEFDRFEKADIRFGISDLADPFKVDEDAMETQRQEDDTKSELETVGKPLDVTGDGGVTKKLIYPGDGKTAEKGAEVTVEYIGRLENGSIFDNSRNRKGGFSFKLGAGQVIKGWEAGVASMRTGEIAEFKIEPSYAYGRRGMPPVIPGNALLTFEIELMDCRGGQSEDIRKVADFNPDVARTPSEIAKEYGVRKETRAEREREMSLLDRFYIISPFASQTGERPPWWINPNITFIGILAFCALGFYLVITAGGIHVGYVDQPVDVNIFK